MSANSKKNSKPWIDKGILESSNSTQFKQHNCSDILHRFKGDAKRARRDNEESN